MCCPKQTALLFGLFVSFFLLAECDIEVQVLTKANPCESTCKEAFPTSPANASRCRRGCRLLRLARLTKTDIDGAAKCQSTCAVTHGDAAERAACALSCGTPFSFPSLAQRELDVVDQGTAEVEVSWAVYVQGGADILPVQPDMEPDDVLTDPGLRRQLELGVEELPQTHIRSMDNKQPAPRTGGELAWCGLPPFANLLLVILGCVLALYLCAADTRTEPRGHAKVGAAADKRGLLDPLDADERDLLDLPPKYSELEVV